MIADLKPVSHMNSLVKFADDLTLLVPENSDTELGDEFDSIKDWAARNKMIINFTKTKEIVFRRPKPARPILPPCLAGIERVIVAKLLGVFLNDTLSFNEHVSFIITQCSQRFYLLRSLRNRGLPAVQLEAIFSALILSRIIYAMSAWCGFVSAAGRRRIDTVLLKGVKYGYTRKSSNVESLLLHGDHILFKKAQCPSHCLFKMLPSIRAAAATLRDRGHPYVLPLCKHTQYKNSFIIRSPLFQFV
jgi:hypothetical protein